MFKKSQLFLLKCHSSLHAGSGDNLGVIDLPIQRERHTGFPKIESSSLKGCIREVFDNNPGNIKNSANNNIKYSETVSLIFGPEGSGDDSARSGSLGFTDARILLFPVKSVKGVFAYTTCPLILKRLKEEMDMTQFISTSKLDKSVITKAVENIGKLNGISAGKVAVTKDSNITIEKNSVILEEYSFSVINENIEGIAEILSVLLAGEKDIKNKLAVISDDDFRDFVTLSTEVITRTKINSETGTVAPGMLFTEEYLPPETVLYSFALASPVYMKKEEKARSESYKNLFGPYNENSDNSEPESKKVIDYFIYGIKPYIQIGGNATIGKGIVKTFVPESL